MALRKSFIEIGYKVNKSGLTAANSAVDQLIRKQERLLNNLDEYSRRTKAVTNGQRESNDELSKTTALQSKATQGATENARAQGRVTDSVAKTKNEQEKLATSQGKTRRKAVETSDEIVRSNEKSTKAIDRTRHSTERTTSSFDRLHGAGNRLINMGTGISMAMLPVAAAFKQSAEEATNLENKYTTIRNLLHTGGESAAASAMETRDMERENNKFALQYGVSPVDMSKGGEELIRRGYSGNQELASHKYFLQAARASGDDYGSVVGYGAPALEQFGYKTKAGDSQKKMAAYTKTVLNQMAYGADLSATDFTGIGNSLRYAGATAHSANQSLAGTIGAIGVLSNNGQDGTVSGTGLRKDINSLLNPTSGPKGQGVAALKSIGLKPDDLRDSKDNLLTLDKAFELLNNHMKGMNDTERASVFHGLFGTTGQESALILAKNVDQMKSLTAQVQNAEKKGNGQGYIADLAQKNMKSWKNQIDVFKQYINIMGLGFTKTILPGFTHMLSDTNSVLKVLIKLPQPAKELTGHIVALGSAMAVAYAGSKLLRKGLDWMGTSGSRKVKGQTALVRDVVQNSIPATNAPVEAVPANRSGSTHFVTAAETLGSRSGSTHYAGGLGAVRNVWGGMSGLSKLAVAGVGIDVGSQAVNAFKQGINTKSGGQKLWESAGTATGAAIGGVLTGGNPVGIMIGQQIGKSFAKTVKASDFLKPDKNNDQKHNAHKDVDPNHTPSLHDGGENSWQADSDLVGSLFGPQSSSKNKSRSSNNRSKPEKKVNPFDSLPKDARKATQTATKLVGTANENWARTAADFSMKQTKRITSDENLLMSKNSSKYVKAYNSLSDYVNKSTSKSSKAASLLQKVGALSASGAQSALSSQNSYNQRRLSLVKQDYSAIERDERNGGKNRVALIQKLNNDILRLTDKGNQQQSALIKNLNLRTTRLTSSQYKSVISQSDKAYSLTKANAKKSYNSSVSAAEKQYNQTLKAAKQLYGVHSSEYKQIKKYADKQYVSTTNRAYDQYQGTLKWAKKQHTDVVAEAKAEAKEAADAWSDSAKSVIDSIPTLFKQNKSAGTGTQPAKMKKHGLDKSLAQKNNALNTTNTANSSSKVSDKKVGMPSVFGGHATGGPIRATQMAAVNEAGTEVAYNPRTGRFRLLGNGPAFAKLYAGEHIINAKDTRKLFAGGLGKGKTLKGYATGTTSLGNSSIGGTIKTKGFGDPLAKATKSTKKSMATISKTVTSGYDKSTKKSNQLVSKFNTKSNRNWKGIQTDTGRFTDRIQKNTVGDYDQMQKGADKQLLQMKGSQLATMSKIHSGMNSETKAIESDFDSIMGKLPGDAKSAMKGAISSLNGGFTGINSTLSQFGGNKNVLKPIHYAQGSRGPIDSDQLAVLNDANFGSRQELVGRGTQLLKPVGDNVAVHLRKGDEVFNGDQVERAKPYLPHFAKGTGASDDKLRSLASGNSGNPSKAFSHDFTSNVKATGAPLQRGVTNTAKAGAKTVGVPWTGAMYGYIESLINSGGGGPVLSAPGPGWSITSGFGNRGAVSGGFSSHDGNDYSGAKLVRSMQDSVVTGIGTKAGWEGNNGIGQYVSTKGGSLSLIYQELNGKAGSGAQILVHVGDHVKQGQSLAKLGPAGTHVHVGASTEGLWSHGGGSTKGWLDVTKLKGNFGNPESKKKKATPALTKLVKSQLGSTAIKWIENNLQDAVGGGQVGGTVSTSMIEKAAKAMHVNLSGSELSTIKAVIQHESGGSSTAVNNWDVNAKNGTPSKGILQFIDPTFKNYAVKGHEQILSAYDQLLAMFNDSGWRHDVHTGGWGPTGSRRFATGGRPNVGESVVVGEKGPELVDFDRPATVRSADATRQLMSRAGGTKVKPNITNTFHIDIHVDAKGGDVDEIVKKVGAKLRDELDEIVHAEMDNLAY
ncbi:phage tail tape measure protein [Levilactobacillus enshiensis]|uniref:phage tail tape measure protein n=1 Tax=Levilactobacillus enshiensis TaxID=2590213 RepID=UPI00117AA1E6|nr:phage tail tape measure protein [Levilactobacillus enshiensis]